MSDHPTPSASARIAMWLVESRLAEPVLANVERMSRSEDVQQIAIMPDVHWGRGVNNGTVVATQHLIYPQAVGGDIGCGIAAIRFSDTAEVLQTDPHVKTIIRELYGRVPALKQRGGRQLPERLNQLSLSHDSLSKKSQREGAYQIGTLGCGNHFAELQEDEAPGAYRDIREVMRAQRELTRQVVRLTPKLNFKYPDRATEP